MSLAPRLFIVLLLPIAFCLGTFGLSSVRLRRQLMMEEAAREMRDHGTALQVALDAFLQDRNATELSTLVQDLSRPDRLLGVLIYDTAGNVIQASRSIAGYGSELAGLAGRAHAGGHPAEGIYDLPGHRVYAFGFLAGPPADPSSRVTAVILRDVAYIDANVAAFTRRVLGVSAAALCAIALATWLAMRVMVATPLAALALGVERVSKGHLDVVIAVARNDEIGRLGDAFNHMTASLAQARRELDSKQEANLGLERRLQHAQRLALIGQLTATIAHQIGSPLNVILGRARYALKLGGQGERDRRHFEEIIAGAESISQAIERLLSQARRVRGPVEPVDVGQVVRQTFRFLEAECERHGIATTFRVDSVALVEGRYEELEQVILNLCLNAIHAQPEGGRLSLAVRHAGDNGRRIVEVEVTDAGPGVPMEMRERIFEPFFTTKPLGKGTGLGLAICDEIVRRHGGSITVTDTPGGGAAFCMSLPTYEPPRVSC